jgi:hypothetical protein
VLTGLLTLLVGAPLGLIWAAVRPHFDVAEALLEESHFETQLGSDLRYALIVAAGGVAVGAVAWAFGRTHGTGVAIGLLVGGALAGLIAWRTGFIAAHPDHLRAQIAAQFQAHGLRPFSTLDGDNQHAYIIDARFDLRAKSLSLLLPTTALTTFAGLYLWRDRGRARRTRRLSWG